MSSQFTQFLQEITAQLDYFAIFALMAAESSILPVPSELVMIPAGYLVSQGKLDFWLVMMASSMGSISGSLASYYLALWLGRPLILKFGKYFLITADHLNKTEQFVKRHGEISIFTGRFIPGVRHLISMPAGLVRMRIPPFVIYTLVGASLWNLVLLILGYIIQGQQAWLEQNLSWVIAGAVLFAGSVVAIYIVKHSQRSAKT